MFWNVFYNLCIQRETSPNAVCKEIGLSNSTATYWKNGTIPKGDVLVQIANFFDVSTDYLLGRTDIPKADSNSSNTHNQENSHNADTIKQNFITLFDSLSPENQIEVMYFTKQLTKKENEK